MQAGIPLAAFFTVSVLIDGKVVDTKHKVKSSSDGGTIDFDLSKAKPKS